MGYLQHQKQDQKPNLESVEIRQKQGQEEKLVRQNQNKLYYFFNEGYI